MDIIVDDGSYSPFVIRNGACWRYGEKYFDISVMMAGIGDYLGPESNSSWVPVDVPVIGRNLYISDGAEKSIQTDVVMVLKVVKK